MVKKMFKREKKGKWFISLTFGYGFFDDYKIEKRFNTESEMKEELEIFKQKVKENCLEDGVEGEIINWGQVLAIYFGKRD